MSQSSTVETATERQSSTPTTTSGASPRATQLKVAASRAGDFDAQERALAPVQQHGGKGDTGSVHAAAGHGISGGATALPHGGTIQQAFGGYDISNVQAHTDAKASEGASAMGADAYATGNHIAFAGAPDLHTAAHEAAHVVQQQAGVQLSGGVGSVGDPYERHADKVADAVVAGKSAEPILSEMAGGGSGKVQMRAREGAGEAGSVQMHTSNVQRDETTPTPTPHADAALEHVNANGFDTASTDSETGAPKVFSVPQDYNTYVAHIRTTFAAELAEVAAMKALQKGKSTELEDKEARLTLDAEELNWFRHELDVLGKEIDELDKLQQLRHGTLEAIKGYQNMTMEDMHKAMSDLMVKYAAKLGALADSEKAEIEALMYASIELGGQLNPELSGKVRLLYLDKIDNQENARLVAVAESEGMELAELAEIGVKFRTWSKTFVRTELMDDKHASEILFMRDLGLDGNQVGVTPESLATKLFLSAQKKAKVPEDKRIPFSKAEQAQQIGIYQTMLAKAKTTNPNVNAALTAPRMNRPLGLPDDQPSPTPAPKTESNSTR